LFDTYNRFPPRVTARVSGVSFLFSFGGKTEKVLCAVLLYRLYTCLAALHTPTNTVRFSSGVVRFLPCLLFVVSDGFQIRVLDYSLSPLRLVRTQSETPCGTAPPIESVCRFTLTWRTSPFPMIRLVNPRTVCGRYQGSFLHAFSCLVFCSRTSRPVHPLFALLV